jgi:hypothetical protein
LADRSGFERAAGGDFAEQGDDGVAGDELAGDGSGLAGFGLVVLEDELNGATKNAAGCVDFVDGEA